MANNPKIAQWVPWLFEKRPVEVEEDDPNNPKKKKKVQKPFGWGTSVSDAASG